MLRLISTTNNNNQDSRAYHQLLLQQLQLRLLRLLLHLDPLHKDNIFMIIIHKTICLSIIKKAEREGASVATRTGKARGWVTTGASLEAPGSGLTQHTSSTCKGKVAIGLMCARVRWVTRLLPSSET